MSPGVASPEETRAGLRLQPPARVSFLRPVDGAGTWRHTAPHSRLRLTTFGTLLLTGLLTIAFLLTVKAGRALVCDIDQATAGKPTHSYCKGFHPEGAQP